MKNPSKRKSFWSGKYGPMLIAEIGANHEGNFSEAKKLVKLAIKADVDVIKFQLYTGAGIVNKEISKKRFKHFKKFELSKSQHIYLAQMVKDNGKKYSASVWDLNMIPWINKYMNFYKIGSGDLTAYPVIKKIAERKKPILLSSGLSNFDEIKSAIRFISKQNKFYNNKKNIALLQCTSSYPCEDDEINLQSIRYLKKKTGLHIGFSDHSIGSIALLASYFKEAEIMEFHFTDTREGKSFRDHKVSLTASEVKFLQENFLRIKLFNGKFEKKITPSEKRSKNNISFRRAIYPARNINAGEIIKEQDLICLRPCIGIDARLINKILNKKTKKKLKKLQKINLSDFK